MIALPKYTSIWIQYAKKEDEEDKFPEMIQRIVNNSNDSIFISKNGHLPFISFMIDVTQAHILENALQTYFEQLSKELKRVEKHISKGHKGTKFEPRDYEQEKQTLLKIRGQVVELLDNFSGVKGLVHSLWYQTNKYSRQEKDIQLAK